MQFSAHARRYQTPPGALAKESEKSRKEKRRGEYISTHGSSVYAGVCLITRSAVLDQSVRFTQIHHPEIRIKYHGRYRILS